jgi:hypothetical protein
MLGKSTGILLLPLVLWLYGCTSNTSFQTFTSASGGFSVQIPDLPTPKTTQVDSPYGPLVEYDYYAVYDDVAYTVGYITLPDELHDELKRQRRTLDDLSGLVSHAKGRLLGERGVIAEGTRVSGKEVLIALPDGKHDLVSRVFLSGKTLYLIHAIIPKKPSYNQDLYSTRFLNSLRIVERS